MKTIEQLYEQKIKPMSIADQLRLDALITENLAAELDQTKMLEKNRRSIMELHGSGAEIWEGVDAQDYINELRKEWDHRP